MEKEKWIEVILDFPEGLKRCICFRVGNTLYSNKNYEGGYEDVTFVILHTEENMV